MGDKERLEAIARMIAAEMGETANQPERRFGADKPPPPTTPAGADVERESRLRWLRTLRRHLRLIHVELLFDKALIGKRGLEELTNQELASLHRTIEQAFDDYYNNEDAYDDVGLLRKKEDAS